jgi:SHS family lactate transporter-like MFS transporter
MWDAFDFATVSLTVTEVAKEFGVENSEVTWLSTCSSLRSHLRVAFRRRDSLTDSQFQGITITLMLRSVGALIFGAISDRYGRKWVMIFTLFLFIIVELATGFTRSLSEFLAVRALYGIAIWVIQQVEWEKNCLS